MEFRGERELANQTGTACEEAEVAPAVTVIVAWGAGARVAPETD
jgi:hypothetical protein